MLDSETVIRLADELAAARARGLLGAARVLDEAARGLGTARVIWNSLVLEGPLADVTARRGPRGLRFITGAGMALMSPMAWTNDAARLLNKKATALRVAASPRSWETEPT